ncbi:lysophospholipase L1-like esterase [Actinoplanes octamycinicus]|uniref:Lysophospholipase L1-like esterase n=1 Tax=Actinoplanes octamycinicus TaxID=135948 RepID=A0A7W7M973_9ACTN|nr:SGNH/GDSL hydrolase family protein [Actinoplanes octamycinicus]MBB4741632.1 lysophospholipase L1-like esterase [Actinoplanes octamycinicus]GIE57184.1 lipolytic enzyme, G-D-S-L [Actinoplanes octamycinicus]
MRRERLTRAVIAVFAWAVLTPAVAVAQEPIAGAGGSPGAWTDAWTGSIQGVYPVGYSVAQPGTPGPAGPGNTAPLLTAAFPDNQARNQTLRMIVHPNVAGTGWRIRLSNEFGTRPVTFGRAAAGRQSTGGNVAAGTNRALTFAGRRSVTVPAGRTVLSDPVAVPITDAASQRLAVSLHVTGASGPMTWHAAAFTTSYLAGPDTGDHTGDLADTAFPYSTTSWFFVSAVQAQRRDAATVVAFGDSITDGFFSTINGDDRWPDVLQRRLDQGRPGKRPISVVTEAIGGNMVTRIGRTPGGCTPCDGPPALDRLDRDVLDRPGVRVVILLEGINDLGGGGATAEQVITGYREIVRRVHARGIKIIGATLTPSAGTAFGLYGTPETDAKRRTINDFIRTGGLFDGVADFAAVTEDPANPGHLLPAFDTNSSAGGPGDHLHPNRAGFLAMAGAIDVAQLRSLV